MTTIGLIIAKHMQSMEKIMHRGECIQCSKKSRNFPIYSLVWSSPQLVYSKSALINHAVSCKAIIMPYCDSISMHSCIFPLSSQQGKFFSYAGLVASYECFGCGSKFVLRKSFDIHINRSSQCFAAIPGTNQCGKCKEQFGSLEDLQNILRDICILQ